MAAETIRLSASILCRIQDPEGRYALLRDRDSEGAIIDTLKPVGGCVAVTHLGKASLNSAAGIQPGQYEDDSGDLRVLDMPVSAVGALYSWFYHTRTSKKLREIDPDRELEEELVDESHVLPEAKILSGMSNLRIGYYSNFSLSYRNKAPTVRVAEVHQVYLPGLAITTLVQAAGQGNDLLYFADETEIMQGHTKSGGEIATTAQSLIGQSRYPINPLENRRV